jgi:hypothetical protein
MSSLQVFQTAKRVLRSHQCRTKECQEENHPFDMPVEEVAEFCGILPRELAIGHGPSSPHDLIQQARKDLLADYQSVTDHSGGQKSWEPRP